MLATGGWRLEENEGLFEKYQELLQAEVKKMNAENEGQIILTIGQIGINAEAEYGSMSFAQIDGFTDNARSNGGDIAISCEFGGKSIQIGYFDLMRKYKVRELSEEELALCKVTCNATKVWKFNSKFIERCFRTLELMNKTTGLPDYKIKELIVEQTLRDATLEFKKKVKEAVLRMGRDPEFQKMFNARLSLPTDTRRRLMVTPFVQLRRMPRL
jgi:hypothetical protein